MKRSALSLVSTFTLLLIESALLLFVQVSALEQELKQRPEAFDAEEYERLKKSMK